jgi:hypothetical protein
MMAPLQRRTNLTTTGIVAIVSLVILFLGGIFCTVIFFKVCSKQRRREKAARKMQEERMPFVTDQYTTPVRSQSAQTQYPSQHKDLPLVEYYGPLELQGSGRLEPQPVQQLDGYTAAVRLLT